MREKLQDLFEKRVNQFVTDKRSNQPFFPKAEQKQAALEKRSAEIVKVKALGKIIESYPDEEFEAVKY
jgi:hypothetical protein